MGRLTRNDGQVPDGWQVVRLGDVAEEQKRRANSSREAEVFSVTKHAGFVRSLEYFNRQVFSRDTSNYKLVRRGDLAYATIHLDEGSLGIFRDTDIGMISPMYTVFEVDRARVEPEFLFSLMKLPEMVAQYGRIGEGTVHRRKSISFERLGRLSFAMPALKDQRSILAVLNSIDKAIERTEAVITPTERLRDALLHELLTRGIPGWHTEWKEVPGIGTIPADWEVVRLGDVAEVASGQCDPKEPRFQKLLFVAPNDIESATGRLVTRRTVADARAISGKYRFDQYDVLYSKIRPYLNKVHVPNEPGLCSADMYPLRPLRALDRTYLALTLLSPKFTAYTRTCSDRTGIPKINRPDLLRYSLALPPLVEQLVIAVAFDGVDLSIKRMREEQYGLQSLKISIGEALLTGKIRMPTNGFWEDG